MSSCSSGDQKSETGSYRAQIKVRAKLHSFWTLEKYLIFNFERRPAPPSSWASSSSGMAPGSVSTATSPSLPLLPSSHPRPSLTLLSPSYKDPGIACGPLGGPSSRIISRALPQSHPQGLCHARKDIHRFQFRTWTS